MLIAWWLFTWYQASHPFEALCYTRSETLLLYRHNHLGFWCWLAQLDIAFEHKLMSILHTYLVATVTKFQRILCQRMLWCVHFLTSISQSTCIGTTASYRCMWFYGVYWLWPCLWCPPYPPRVSMAGSVQGGSMLFGSEMTWLIRTQTGTQK